MSQRQRESVLTPTRTFTRGVCRSQFDPEPIFEPLSIQWHLLLLWRTDRAFECGFRVNLEAWLMDLGLEQYANAFAENGVDRLLG